MKVIMRDACPSRLERYIYFFRGMGLVVLTNKHVELLACIACSSFEWGKKKRLGVYRSGPSLIYCIL